MSEPFAVIGLFDTAQALTDAVPKIRKNGFASLEAYTPYPVHHLDKVLGLKRSPLGVMVLVMGLVGTMAAVALQGWTNAFDYPFAVGGKPLFSWQAFVPVMFEVTVLFATFTAGLAMLFVLNKLPFFGHPLLASRAISRITRDRFALSIERGQGVLDPVAAKRALEEAGAKEIEVLATPDYGPSLSARSALKFALAIACACLFAGTATWAGVKLVLDIPPMVHMGVQPKVNAQRGSDYFSDGRGMRLPVKGTVARGYLPYVIQTPEEAASALVNPLPRTRAVLAQGQLAYNEHCAVCHGTAGNGEPTLSSAYGAKPANLGSPAITEYADGRLYHAIMLGKNAMPGYAADMSEDDRWATVHYVRALQRSQNAKLEDLP